MTVRIPYSTTETVTVDGVVDFDRHEGHLVVATTSGDASETQDVDYTAGTVYERGGPLVTREIAASGRRGVQWVSRAPDTRTRPIDKIIAILVALASPERDNPLLVEQGDATWQGTGRVGGTLVDRYRYSSAIEYAVGAHDGLLREFLGTVQGFAGTVVVELSDPGPKHVPPPPAATVLAAGTGQGG